jgi:hypothetical protein
VTDAPINAATATAENKTLFIFLPPFSLVTAEMAAGFAANSSYCASFSKKGKCQDRGDFPRLHLTSIETRSRPRLLAATLAALPSISLIPIARLLRRDKRTSIKVMGHNYARNNVRKRAARRKKMERLSAAKKNKKKTAK